MRPEHDALVNKVTKWDILKKVKVKKKEEKKNFLKENIRNAIILTQYNLRGFVHPSGFREYGASAEGLDSIVGGFMPLAAGYDSDAGQTTCKVFVTRILSSFEEYLAMCKQLAEDCDEYEKEAIQTIVKDVIRQSEEIKKEVFAGYRRGSSYLRPLKKDNNWGKEVIALAEAFAVSIEAELGGIAW